jgi:CubicO group peptidase (beta-lactamase class C family)
MLFDIGTMSMPFTAAAILKLQTQGKLRVQDPIVRHLPALKSQPDLSKAKAAITIHQLLSHTSGIADEISFSGVDLTNRDEMVVAVMKPDSRVAPGKALMHTNYGYLLLAAIVETASEQGFEPYLKEQILTPAGMTDTTFIRDPKVDRARETMRILRAAKDNRSQLAERVSYHTWSWGFRGATGMLSTVGDLHRFDLALREDKLFDAKTKAKYFQPVRQRFAYGWHVEKRMPGGITVQYHPGKTIGYSSQFARYPDHNALVVVLTNDQNDPMAVHEKLESILFPKVK